LFDGERAGDEVGEEIGAAAPDDGDGRVCSLGRHTSNGETFNDGCDFIGLVLAAG
jgi:hypothetical protein